MVCFKTRSLKIRASNEFAQAFITLDGCPFGHDTGLGGEQYAAEPLHQL